jgi:hypothetical protein
MSAYPEKEQKAMKVPGSSKKDGGWTLLFVGDRGKIIPLRPFKPLALALALTLGAALAAAVSLFYLYQDKMDENRNLQNELVALRQQNLSLQQEKSVLMARQPVQSSAKYSGLPNPEIQTEHPPKESPLKSISFGPNRGAADLGNQAVPGDIAPEPKVSLVAIEDFSVSYSSDRRRLSVKYNIKKSGTAPHTISGRTFVIIKNREGDSQQWLTLPAEKLVSGKPISVSSGRLFKISNFFTVKFKADLEKDLKPFTHATVLVYSEKGEILLEKNFPIADIE